MATTISDHPFLGLGFHCGAAWTCTSNLGSESLTSPIAAYSAEGNGGPLSLGGPGTASVPALDTAKGVMVLLHRDLDKIVPLGYNPMHPYIRVSPIEHSRSYF